MTFLPWTITITSFVCSLFADLLCFIFNIVFILFSESFSISSSSSSLSASSSFVTYLPKFNVESSIGISYIDRRMRIYSLNFLIACDIADDDNEENAVLIENDGVGDWKNWIIWMKEKGKIRWKKFMKMNNSIMKNIFLYSWIQFFTLPSHSHVNICILFFVES